MPRVVLYLLLFLGSSAVAQLTSPLRKAKSTFVYVQGGALYGHSDEWQDPDWGFSNIGPGNRLFVQVRHNSNRNQQLGYTKLFAFSGWKIKGGLRASVLEPGSQMHSDLKFSLLDTWISFNTKWDRTQLIIGKKGFAYGHNPRIDPVASFRASMVRKDIGFTQDVGVFWRTAVDKEHDLEVSLTSGGFLSDEVAQCDSVRLLSSPGEQDFEFYSKEVKYDNTWLLTARYGSPTFRAKESGVFLLLGRLPCPELYEGICQVARLGVDRTFKYKERFKTSGQIAIGTTSYEEELSNTITFNAHANAEYYVPGFLVIGCSAYLGTQSFGFNQHLITSTFMGSVTFPVLPEVRVGYNQWLNLSNYEMSGWAGLFHLEVGLGQK